MIVVEYYRKRNDGVELVKTFSSDGYYIVQQGTGVMYPEAIDPIDSGRVYVESDEKIGPDEPAEGDEESAVEEPSDVPSEEPNEDEPANSKKLSDYGIKIF